MFTLIKYTLSLERNKSELFFQKILSIVFIETCINEGLLPKRTYANTGTQTPHTLTEEGPKVMIPVYFRGGNNRYRKYNNTVV